MNKADALALEAEQLSSEGKYEEAIEKYDKAISIYPSNADLWVSKAITLSGGLNRYEEARQCWEKAKKLDSVIADAIKYKTPPKKKPTKESLKHKK